MKTVAAFFMTILFASQSFAAADCSALKEELQAMQKAQAQIMNSLVSNHETFASSMEEYSLAMEKSSASAVKGVSKEMNSSAQAFRTRGVQGKKMAQQLDAATSDLLARVASCLK